MKLIRLLTFLAGSVIVVATATATPLSSEQEAMHRSLYGFDGSVKYSPPDNAFKVTFPAKPECKEEEIETATGKVVVHVCWHANSNSELKYSVTFCDGLQVPENANYAGILRESMRSIANATSSSIVEYRSLEIGGFPAIESVMRDQNGVMSLSRYVLAHQRIFSIEFSGWRKGAPMEMANAFMNSFQINIEQ